jgi:hypothetical protein
MRGLTCSRLAGIATAAPRLLCVAGERWESVPVQIMKGIVPFLRSERDTMTM